MKQKISVVLVRTAWNGAEDVWKEHKIVEIEVDNPCLDYESSAKWHVAGELEQE